MKLVRHLVLACLFLFAMSSLADGPSVSVDHVWIRHAPVGVMVLSGYMTLENHTDKPLQISSMSSPDFESVTISQVAPAGKPHSTVTTTTFTLPPQKQVRLSQDSFHLHLSQPHKKLYVGDMVTLYFKFSDGSTLSLLAPVRDEPPGT